MVEDGNPSFNADLFEGTATQDAAVAMSGHLKILEVSLIKISNDLRWMHSDGLRQAPPGQPPVDSYAASTMRCCWSLHDISVL